MMMTRFTKISAVFLCLLISPAVAQDLGEPDLTQNEKILTTIEQNLQKNNLLPADISDNLKIVNSIQSEMSQAKLYYQDKLQNIQKRLEALGSMPESGIKEPAEIAAKRKEFTAEEENYKLENISEQIYPWIKAELTDSQALNGKHFSEEDAPVIGFLGDLNVVFAIKRGEDIYEILKDNMLPPECDIIKLYHKACENLNRDVEFVIANTWYGGYGIVADGHHEASSVCFKHIWQVCADKLKDDLIIMIPRKDTVLFAPAGNKDIVEKMIDHGEKAYEQGENKISKKLLMFLREGKELITYEN